jgi:hypothetical protein
MTSPTRLVVAVLTAATVVTGGCSNSGPVAPIYLFHAAPARSETELVAAPDSVKLGTSRLIVKASAWRNFQPTIGSATDTRLVAFVRIVDVSGEGIPAETWPEFAWAIRDHAIWGVRLDDPFIESGTVCAIGRGGPNWPTGDSVVVVAGVRDANGNVHLIRCPDVPILRLD